MIQSRRMRWMGHVACMGEMRIVYRILDATSEGKKPLGDLGVDGTIILKWGLSRVGGYGLDSAGTG
jgi:hypothetical protein